MSGARVADATDQAVEPFPHRSTDENGAPHKILGEGSFDMAPLVRALREMDYRGTMGEQGDKPVREYQIQRTNRHAMSIRHGKWKYLDHKGSGGNNYNRTGPYGMKPYAL